MSLAACEEEKGSAAGGHVGLAKGMVRVEQLLRRERVAQLVAKQQPSWDGGG